MTPELASPSTNYHTTPMGGRFSFDLFNMHRITRQKLHQTRARHPDCNLNLFDKWICRQKMVKLGIPSSP
ncbi:hypothetical protein TNCV_3939961 [Trichonephila clavipes]|uniref:Uncharacterized protein n=1 Tax=Trichonephila clavipes TaxID=2585209 RepID=A0A8X6VVP6_TRICX|nr:hypothetical protein TNCV_3939961 [Trichonephila clavipes]